MVMRGKTQLPPPSVTWAPPEAHIEQIGRFTWSVTIRHGALAGFSGGYWTRIGRRAAERTAHRALDRYNRKLSTHTIIQSQTGTRQ
jgi:hypothetical protein